ncbi:MAG: hypothetical protein LBL07_09440, partial [Tannerella sp.]|nr:hypothetical protein [Tannerella sp.]
VSLATFYYAIFAVIYTAASWTIHSFFAAKVMILYEINNTLKMIEKILPITSGEFFLYAFAMKIPER